MTINVNYGYVPTIHKQSDIPGRTSRICYADNDSVPPEKRGKEISDEDYKIYPAERTYTSDMVSLFPTCQDSYISTPNI